MNKNKDLFTVIGSEEVRFLMSDPNFCKNAILIDNKDMYDEYGTNTYLVRISWLNDKFNK
jgi:hypothetical protein